MADTSEHLKAVVLENSFYTLWYEQYQNLTFVHVDVHVNYTPTVKQSMLRDLKTLMSLRSSPLFVFYNPAKNIPAIKLLKLYGFSFLQNVSCLDGSIREIYIRREA